MQYYELIKIGGPFIPALFLFPLESRSLSDKSIYLYLYIYIFMYIFICIYVYIYCIYMRRSFPV